MSMPVFYILGNGSLYEDWELRYSLRSLDKYGANVDSVTIVGRLPSFLTGVQFIECADKYREHCYRDRNILDKCLIGVNALGTGLMFNDDHFLMQEVDCEAFPYYYRESDMQITINNNPKNPCWRTTIQNTRDFLVSKGYNCKMFDCHTPIIYSKEAFLAVLGADWGKAYGYGIKSLYGNINGVNGVLCRDGKVFGKSSERAILNTCNFRPVLSTSPILGNAKGVIESLFPYRSKWEK